MQKFGWRQSIVVGVDGVIVAGHKRGLAAIAPCALGLHSTNGA